MKKLTNFILLLTFFLLFSCGENKEISTGEDLLKYDGNIQKQERVLEDGETGKITGIVIDRKTEDAIPDVEIKISAKGISYKTVSDEKGLFSLDVNYIKQGEGYNIHFKKKDYLNATRAAVFKLPNLRVDLKKIILYGAIK
jgi:hypothetical protein